MPVEGPPRWLTKITEGTSAITQRQARARGRRGGPRARIAGADRGRDRRDLVLGLQQPAAPLGHLDRQALHDRGRRGDRIAEEGGDPGVQAALHDRAVAGHHHGIGALVEVRGRPERDVVQLEVGAGRLEAGVEGADVALAHGRRLGLELVGDDLVEGRDGQAVEPGQEAEHDDVARAAAARGALADLALGEAVGDLAGLDVGAHVPALAEPGDRRVLEDHGAGVAHLADVLDRVAVVERDEDVGAALQRVDLLRGDADPRHALAEAADLGRVEVEGDHLVAGPGHGALEDVAGRDGAVAGRAADDDLEVGAVHRGPS
jgi:hypothetical protein